VTADTDVAIRDALAAAVEAIYRGDDSDYGDALWRVVVALGGSEASTLMDYDVGEAYRRYCLHDRQ